jgi:hypothetical protein
VKTLEMGWICSSLNAKNVAVLRFLSRFCLHQTMVSFIEWLLKWFGVVTACVYLGCDLSRERQCFASKSFTIDRSHPSSHLAFYNLCNSEWVVSELRNKQVLPVHITFLLHGWYNVGLLLIIFFSSKFCLMVVSFCHCYRGILYILFSTLLLL